MPNGEKALDEIRQQLDDNPGFASDGNHSARLWRIVENVQAHADKAASDDRLLHLMSRIGVLTQGMAHDLREGHLSVADAAMLLDQLGVLGTLSFDQWRGHS